MFSFELRSESQDINNSELKFLTDISEDFIKTLSFDNNHKKLTAFMYHNIAQHFKTFLTKRT